MSTKKAGNFSENKRLSGAAPRGDFPGAYLCVHVISALCCCVATAAGKGSGIDRSKQGAYILLVQTQQNIHPELFEATGPEKEVGL